MTGNMIDSIIYKFKRPQKDLTEDTFFIDTDYGKIRVLDTKETKPIIINVPDGPNVIEHQLDLIKKLAINFRVVCFEYPGLGFSYPNNNYNYSIENGSSLLLQLMDILKLEKVSLLFSCSNGFYAMNLAQITPDRINYIFLSQTPSFSAMLEWTNKSIPNILEVPFIGQTTNAIFVKKLIKTWYKYSLPKGNEDDSYKKIALESISKGGCFCLSALVQGLKKDSKKQLCIDNVPTILIWGTKDYSHRRTDKESIRVHIKECEIIEFTNCGHFPELEDSRKMVKLINERVK